MAMKSDRRPPSGRDDPPSDEASNCVGPQVISLCTHPMRIFFAHQFFQLVSDVSWRSHLLSLLS